MTDCSHSRAKRNGDKEHFGNESLPNCSFMHTDVNECLMDFSLFSFCSTVINKYRLLSLIQTLCLNFRSFCLSDFFFYLMNEQVFVTFGVRGLHLDKENKMGDSLTSQ